MKKTIISILILTLLLCTVGCKNTKGDNIVPSSTPETSSNDEVTTSKPNETSKPKPNNTSSSVNTEPTRPEKVTKKYAFRADSTVTDPIKETFYDSENGNTLKYCLYLPDDYTPSKKYPVILFLHGAGELGTDNSTHIKNLEKMFLNNADYISQAILLCPQTPEWWRLDRNYVGDEGGTLGSAKHLLEKIQKEYSCDNDRIYVTGLSMGGHGTWEMLERYGDVFAAGVPLCGFGNTSNGAAFKDIPIRIYHGTADPTVSYSSSQQMYNAIIAAGGTKVELFPLHGVLHDAWNYAYADRDLFSWMFSQNKTKGVVKYSPPDCFRIVDSKGKTVISDKDIDMVDYVFDYWDNVGGVDIKIWLTKEGQAKLKNAYLSSGGKEFTVYCLSNKICSFKATKAPIDDLFLIKGVFEEFNYLGFYNTLEIAALK